MNKIHAVVTGSLHNENIGDYGLLKSFVERHKNKYQKLTVIGLSSQDVLVDIEHSIFPQPHLAIGYRFWRGYKERAKTKKMIVQQLPDAWHHYIWLGGLLGSNNYHNKYRCKELIWSSTFCHKLIYYFGDVEPKFNSSDKAKKLIKIIDKSNPWIAVRSVEAANLLVETGLRSKIYIGIDAVLYDRCNRWGIPFTRHKKDSGSIAIVVCNYLKEINLEIWRASALSAIKFGLTILWVSLCDSEDLVLCKQLYREFSEQNPKHPMEIISGIDGESRIADASVCVATRFHGAIFSLTAGVPTIAVPYGAKVKRLFKFLNLEDWVADPILNNQNNVNWNSIISEMVRAALEGKWQPNYTLLKAGIKAHENALSELDLILTN